MLRQHRSVLIGAITCAAACVGFSSSFAEGVRSVELSHDDGTSEGSFAAQEHRELAVGFEAPGGTQWLLGVRFYIADDGEVDPNDPELPTTKPFMVWAREYGDGGQPGACANVGYTPCPDSGLCPEDAWLDVTFPEPIDISDPVSFPGGRFYVGLEWWHRNNPCIGLDLDAPLWGETQYWNWSAWSVVDTANAMIRAVVSDSTAVPVELRSWGSVKNEYR
jgi:hypothetical protein